MAIVNTVVPIIHLNGTSKEALLKQADTAYSALYQAREKLRDMHPNARDYYVTPGSFEIARDQHNDRITALTRVLVAIQDIMIGIQKQE